MSGIIENMHAELQTLKTEMQTLKAHVATLQAGGGTPAVAPAATDPFAPFGGTAPAAAPAAPVNVTREQLLALIQPHLDNDATKTALGNAMRAAGYSALDQIPEAQYGAMYGQFQAIVTAAPAATAPAAGGLSIV